jgi:metal-sulfur cluster biosynthetic enzyme
MSVLDWLKRNDDAERAQANEFENLSLEDRVIDALRTVYDPEIPVNIYDLGLIYGIQVDSASNVQIQMTLTAWRRPFPGPWRSASRW